MYIYVYLLSLFTVCNQSQPLLPRLLFNLLIDIVHLTCMFNFWHQNCVYVRISPLDLAYREERGFTEDTEKDKDFQDH